MNTQTTPAHELVALADRSEFDGNTGIYVRAKCDGKWGSHDIAELSGDSLLAWLRADGGCNALAENTLLTLFNHEQVAQPTRAATLPQGVSSGVVTDAHLVTLWRNQCVNQMSRELAISRSLTYEEGRLLAEEEAIRIEDVFRDSMQKIHEKKQPTPPPAELGKGS